MFNTVDTMHDCTRIATGVVSTLKINPDRMLAGLSADMLATDLAEYLVRKGMWLSTLPTCSLSAITDHNLMSDRTWLAFGLAHVPSMLFGRKYQSQRFSSDMHLCGR